DEMRRGDWAPRSVHRNARRVAEAVALVESRTGRDARHAEVDEAMDLSLDEYHDIIKDSASTRLFSYEETYEEDEGRLDHGSASMAMAGPSERVYRDALQTALAQAVDRLPER